MKPGTITLRRSLSAIAIVTSAVILLSWEQQPSGSARPDDTGNSSLNPERLLPAFTGHHYSDTVPRERKGKVRDIDEAIEELDRVDIDAEIDQAMKGVKTAMEQFDSKKIKLEIDKAMKEINMDDIKAQVEKSMKEVKLDDLKQQIDQSMANIDWDKIKVTINEVKKIDWDGIEKEIRKAQDEVKLKGPEIQRELQNARKEIEKAKKELKEYKTFLDGLESDGLINKKDGYSVEHKDGELKINGKKASEDTYKKYRSSLDAHREFNIEIKDGHFNMNNGSYDDGDNDNENDNDNEDVGIIS